MSLQRLSLSTLLFFLLLASASEAARDLSPPRHPPRDDGGYVVVIDAGSTGSRAHVYRWSPPPSGLSLLPLVAAAAPSLKREPGLSSTRPAEVAGALKPLLEHAAEHVPREHHGSTDVLVLATAGLRALPTQRERDERLAAASDAVASLSPFPRPRPGAVATLRGVDEGALAWVAANAAAGSLVEKKNGKEATTTTTAADARGAVSTPATVGIAEVGGTSMQVTFEVPGGGDDSGNGDENDASSSPSSSSSSSSSPSSPADLFLLELPNANNVKASSVVFRLFSRSWEGLGHEAARATTAAAVSSASASASYTDPCVPPGAVVAPPADVAAAGREKASTSPAKTSAVGTGDFDACRNAASQALKLSCEARPDHCPLPSLPSSNKRNGRPPPRLSGMEILGIENLRHTANALGLLDGPAAAASAKSGRPTLREIVEAGKRLCSFGGGDGSSRSDDEKQEQKPPPPPPPFHVKNPVEAARHCFGAAYTVALLHDAFGVGLDERGVEFSGSVAAVSHGEKHAKRVTPEWTSAAAALAAATKANNAKKATKSKGAQPLPFESLLRPASSPGDEVSSSGLAGFLHRRREHRRLSFARLFVICGALAAAAVVVRSLTSSSSSLSLSSSPSPRKRSYALGDDSSKAAEDALGSSGDGSSPVRGGGAVGWKLSKRGAGGSSTKLDLSAESTSAPSAAAAEKASSLLP